MGRDVQILHVFPGGVEDGRLVNLAPLPNVSWAVSL